MNQTVLSRNIVTVRTVAQWSFLGLILFVGARFAMFVRAVESGGSAMPLAFRSPGVEGFLPIGALTSLKFLVTTGHVHPVHPAALVIFLAICLMSILAKKSFCSWLCPVGTLSEGTSALGRRLFGRTFRIWPWLDYVLRGGKYLLLFFFVKIILFDMPPEAVAAFLDSPYWAVSDIKMLHFFTRMSVTTMVVLTFLTGLSLLYANFWCRYLCPYGALLGLLSILSPFKIRRKAAGCTGCRRCSKACPQALPVHAATSVRSPECTGCLNCVVACPEKDILEMGLQFHRGPLPVPVYPAVLLFLYFAVIGAGMAMGHWQSVLTIDDYRQLVPLMPRLVH
ncbi:MAG: 4Fe-4S binding protein [Thermodesulfobacteriota bacterium]